MKVKECAGCGRSFNMNHGNRTKCDRCRDEERRKKFRDYHTLRREQGYMSPTLTARKQLKKLIEDA